MFPVWIAAFLDSRRSRWLYGHRPMTRALLRAAAASAGLDGAAVVTVSDDPAILEIAAELGMGTRAASEHDSVATIPGPGEHGLVLAPHLGPVTPARVRRVLDLAENHPGRTVVTAPLLPVNCNPAWLSALDGRTLDGNVAPVDGFSHRPALSGEALEALGIKKRVAGSQWLPELHVPDHAIRFVPGERGETLAMHDDPQTYGDLPLFYRLPIFQLHEDQTPDFDLKGIDPEVLLSTRGEASCDQMKIHKGASHGQSNSDYPL